MASVRREFRTAWALLPFAKTRLFPGWELRLSLRRPPWSKECGFILEFWRFKGPMRATSKPRSALDEEIGPSDLDLLNLMDYQALCLGTRRVFPEIPVELNAAKDWRVLGRWKRPERIMGLECEADLWTCRAICRKSQSRERQHLILSRRMSCVCASTKRRSSFWSVGRRARELCGLCLASDASVRCRWFPSERNPAHEPSRRVEWSSQCHTRSREVSNSRLPRQCLLLDEFGASSADNHTVQRAETEENLGRAAAEAARESEQPTEQSKHLRHHLGSLFDEHWRSAPSPTTSKPRFSQPSRTSMLGRPPDLIHRTAPLDAGFCGSCRKNTDHVLGGSSPAP